MKKEANKSRKDVTFELGDHVLVKLKKYRHELLAQRKSSKLYHRFLGPFEFMERIGVVAY